MAVLLLQNEILITDAYKYKAKEVKGEIKKLREENPAHKGLQLRSDRSYLNEWAVHALCYRWNIKRERTKDADLQFEMEPEVKFAYAVLGPIARLFLLFYRH